MRSARRTRKLIDTACGYAMLAYACTTLFWLLATLNPNLGMPMMVTAGFVSLFGLLRSLTLPMRFKLIPLATLVYLVGLTGLLLIAQMPTLQNLYAVFLSGLIYSAVGFLPVYRLYKHDFARPLPAWECRACGYPLFGLTEPSCPECGQGFDPARVPEMPDPTPDHAPAPDTP